MGGNYIPKIQYFFRKKVLSRSPSYGAPGIFKGSAQLPLNTHNLCAFYYGFGERGFYM